MKPACDGCKKAEVECQRKERGPGCVRCAQRKSKCSAVGEKKKTSEKTTKTWSEAKEGSSSRKTPVLEMDQGFVEMVEAMRGDVSGIHRSVYQMGVAIGRIVDLAEEEMMYRRREEAEKAAERTEKVDKETAVDEELEGFGKRTEVEKADKGVETDEESEMGKKDKEIEDESEDDGDKDGEEDEMETGE